METETKCFVRNIKKLCKWQKCVEYSTLPNEIRQRIKKIRGWKLILTNNVIDNALKLIYDNDLKFRGCFDDIGTFGDCATKKFYTGPVKLRRIFLAISGIT